MPSMFSNAISAIDLFSTPVIIRHYGKEKMRTVFGGAISLLFICFMGWALYNSSYDLIFRQNPRVVSSESFTEDPRKMILSPQTFPLAFGVLAPFSMGGNPMHDNTIFTMKLFYTKISKKTLPNGGLSFTRTETELLMETCTPAHFGDKVSSFSSLGLSDLTCIALNQPQISEISVQGSYDAASDYDTLTVRMYKCDSGTSTCASSTTMTQYLTGAYFNMIYTNMVIDANNYEDPDSRYREIAYSLSDPKSEKSISIALKHINVTTDSGWLSSDLETANYIKVDKAEESIINSPNPDNILISFTFVVDKLEYGTVRTYKKIQDILAEVTGLGQTAFIVIFFILTPYLRLKFQESLMNELFHIYHQQKPEKPKENVKLDKEQEKLESDMTERGTRLELQNDQEEPLHRQTTAISPLSVLTKSEPKTSLPSNAAKIIRQENKPSNMFKDDPLMATSDSSGFSSSRALTKNAANRMNHLREAYNESPIFALGKIPNEPWTGYRHGPPKKTSQNRKIVPEDTARESLAEVALDEEGGRKIVKSHTMTAIKLELSKAEHKKVRISFCEYLMSFICPTQSLKKKMELLTQGVQNINERLDVINIMKKLREVDKMKVLLLDDHQLTLFNHLPKPEIRPKSKKRLSTEQAFLLGLLASSKFVEGEKSEEAILSTYDLIKTKQNMTEMDRKLIEIFEKKNKTFLKK